MAAQLPPIDMGTEPLAEEPLEGAEPEEALDPQFAADASEAFPDMDDAQLAALHRAILGCMTGYSGGGQPPM